MKGYVSTCLLRLEARALSATAIGLSTMSLRAGCAAIHHRKRNAILSRGMMDCFVVPPRNDKCFASLESLKIILEIKAVKSIADEHKAQTINYLKSTNNKLGLLVNFGHFPKIQHERFLNQ